MEIDHIYICTENKAPSGDLLVEFGLAEGSSNTHPGQGTTNRRFYFRNFMLELLWIENLKEVQCERTKPMKLFERCELTSNKVSDDKREPMEHKVPLKEVTNVKAHVNQDISLSASACILNQLHDLSIENDKEHFIELEFDNGTLNQTKDFRPNLPLLIKW